MQCAMVGGGTSRQGSGGVFQMENNDVIDLRDISIRLPERYAYKVPEVLDYLEEHHSDMVRTS